MELPTPENLRELLSSSRTGLTLLSPEQARAIVSLGQLCVGAQAAAGLCEGWRCAAGAVVELRCSWGRDSAATLTGWSLLHLNNEEQREEERAGVF